MPSSPSPGDYVLKLSAEAEDDLLPSRQSHLDPQRSGLLNTHFRAFGKPMDLAAGGTRLTIGGTNTVWYYRNAPAVAQKIEPVGKYDGCYLPRRIHVTGNIDIHELAWDKEGELWVVNTCGRLPHPGSKWVLRGQAARPTRTIATVPVRSRRFCRYCVSPASL